MLKAGDDKILVDNGKISHEDAIGKAKDEYKKYQVKTLSQVEMDYIESLPYVCKETLIDVSDEDAVSTAFKDDLD